jgi:hypothetical protein
MCKNCAIVTFLSTFFFFQQFPLKNVALVGRGLRLGPRPFHLRPQNGVLGHEKLLRFHLLLDLKPGNGANVALVLKLKLRAK